MSQTQYELATFGGGCFWCLEACFSQCRGVEQVLSGYMGGKTDQPTYKDVCNGNTGHAEVIQIKFNPAEITFRDLLLIFFGLHDPTTLNRQGADVGTQYRSAIFYHSSEQEKTAQEIIAELNQNETWSRPIVTEVTAAAKFFAAEDYHQNYFRDNPMQPYCQGIVAPKVAKLRQHFGKFVR
jgi:peptide-methionine (S)-S-oxide reductase